MVVLDDGIKRLLAAYATRPDQAERLGVGDGLVGQCAREKQRILLASRAILAALRQRKAQSANQASRANNVSVNVDNDFRDGIVAKSAGCVCAAAGVVTVFWR